MKAEDYRAVKELFLELHDSSPQERERRLAASFTERPDLRAEVERLIAADQLEERNEGALRRGSSKPPPLPDAIGDYRIEGLLGEGGMGVVYRAWQENPPRPVALKVLRPGVISEAALRRFAQEAELLGRLQHPGIATIHDAGFADGGSGEQPFFAMELVEGRPIHEYAIEQDLDTHARLRLIVEVCRAIQHAHEHGVVHRDIKPANILVDASGAPKVLDFGIARTTEEDLRATTLRTRTGELIGTLPYMSPEQLSGEPGAVDTRCDVYALGVLTHELVAGELPFDLAGKPLAEAILVLTEEEPAPLHSTRRGARGDLDTIVGKALAKEPERRYDSAAELAADIDRFLLHEPIAARPASRLYLMRKFARRHRGMVAGLLTAFLTLAVALVLVIGFALEAVDERERAQDDAHTTRAVLGVLTRMIGAPNPSGDWLANRDPYELRVIEVLDTTAAEIGEELAERPAVELGVRMTLARTFYGLGMIPEADVQFTRVQELSRVLDEPGSERALEVKELQALLALRREHREAGMALLRSTYDAIAKKDGPESVRALQLMGHIVSAHRELSEYGEAERLQLESYELSRGAHGDGASITLDQLQRLAELRLDQGRLEEARALARQLLEAREGDVDGRRLATVAARFLIVRLMIESGRQGEALPVLRRTIEELDRHVGPRHPATRDASSWLAGLLLEAEELDEAERLIRKLLDTATEAYGEDHGPALIMLGQLGLCLRGQGKLTEAEDALRRAHAGYLRTHGRLNVNTANMLGNLGEILQLQGREEEAEEMLTEALAIHRETLGQTHPETLTSLNNLARCVQQAGRLEESGELYGELFVLAREHMPKGGVQWAAVLFNYGYSRVLIGRLAEAELPLLEGMELLADSVGPGDPRTKACALRVLDFFAKIGEPASGADFLSSLGLDLTQPPFATPR